MKAIWISGFSLGILLVLGLWLGGQARVLAVDVDTAPLGRRLRLEQDAACFFVMYGELWGLEHPNRISFTAEQVTLVITELPSFLCGPFPGGETNESPRLFILRCPNWYLLVLFLVGLLGPMVRARLIHPRGELSFGLAESGRRVRWCDAVILLGIVLVTVALFWLGSLQRAFANPAHPVALAIARAVLSGGLTLVVCGWIGYYVIGRTRGPNPPP
jgi:hypothetical protein